MKTSINQSEVRGLFEEFVKVNGLETDEKSGFSRFLNYLEIDFYDWIRENLRSYFLPK